MTTQDDLQGLWRRAWIKAPTENPTHQDHTTRVFWAQSGTLYADLRIPLERRIPSGATCLADLDAPALLTLMRAEGFAGTIDVADSVCTWAREINWHGETPDVDAGKMWFTEGGDLIEDGVHADYRELWHHDAKPPLQARRVQAGDLSGILVWSPEMFLLGMGRASAPASAPLIEALEAGDIPAALPAHFDTEYTFGHWQLDIAIADLCTNPFREGKTVLSRHGVNWLWHRAGFDGTLADIPLTSK